MAQPVRLKPEQYFLKRTPQAGALDAMMQKQ